MLIAVPTTIIATGNVDRAGLGANDLPIMPPRKITNTLSDMNNDKLAVSIQTLRGNENIYFFAGLFQLENDFCLLLLIAN